jgi:hypothetical protein
MTMQTRMEQRVRWEPAWGERHDVFDDVLIHASRGLSSDLAAKLGAWDMRALVPYRPEYLAGWRAEEYSVDLEQGWAAALARIEETERKRCSGDVPGDTQRNLRVHNTVQDVRWKHIDPERVVGGDGLVVAIAIAYFALPRTEREHA